MIAPRAAGEGGALSPALPRPPPTPPPSVVRESGSNPFLAPVPPPAVLGGWVGPCPGIAPPPPGHLRSVSFWATSPSQGQGWNQRGKKKGAREALPGPALLQVRWTRRSPPPRAHPVPPRHLDEHSSSSRTRRSELAAARPARGRPRGPPQRGREVLGLTSQRAGMEYSPTGYRGDPAIEHTNLETIPLVTVAANVRPRRRPRAPRGGGGSRALKGAGPLREPLPAGPPRPSATLPPPPISGTRRPPPRGRRSAQPGGRLRSERVADGRTEGWG